MEPQEIQARRKARGWSQEDLARRIGTTAITISRWERGKVKPRGLYGKALAEQLPTPPAAAQEPAND